MMLETESLRISLVQRILSISDTSLLENLDQLLNKNNIVGYDAKGNPFTESEYIADLDKINSEIDNEKAKLSTSENVRKRIINENNLA